MVGGNCIYGGSFICLSRSGVVLGLGFSGTSTASWTSPTVGTVKDGPYSLQVDPKDGDLCVREGAVFLGRKLWCAESGGLGGVKLKADYRWNIGLVNSKGEFVWGDISYSKQRASDNLATSFFSIPGTYIKFTDHGSTVLEAGQFITNGKYYLLLTDRQGLVLYHGNPYKTKSEPVWIQQRFVDGQEGKAYQYKNSFNEWKLQYISLNDKYALVVGPENTTLSDYYTVIYCSRSGFLHMPAMEYSKDGHNWAALLYDPSGQFITGGMLADPRKLDKKWLNHSPLNWYSSATIQNGFFKGVVLSGSMSVSRGNTDPFVNISQRDSITSWSPLYPFKYPQEYKQFNLIAGIKSLVAMNGVYITDSWLSIND
eukprot:gene1009-1146_t